EGAAAGAFEVLEYVMGHSPDLGSAYRKLIRYQRIVHDAAGLRFEIRGSIARFTHQMPPGLVVPRHAPEGFLAGPLAVGRRLTGKPIVPLEVTFTPPAPADTSEHRRFFRADVAFDRPIAAMTLDGALMATPLLGADPALGRVLERYAERLVAA